MTPPLQNGSLRGLSLGGRFLTCDCKVRWVAGWIRDHDLQVTSRERNPQFCGHPQHLRDKNFYQLGLDGRCSTFWPSLDSFLDCCKLIWVLN